MQFTVAATRAGAQVPDVLCDLEQRASHGVQGTAGLDDRVVSCESFELVRGGFEVDARFLGDLLGDQLVEALLRVQPCADSGTTLCEVLQVRQGVLDSCDAVDELLDVAAEFLSEGQRSGVLQVCSADLDDVLELLGLLVEGVLQLGDLRQEGVGDLRDRGDVHHRGESVVGGLRLVAVVVWVDLLGAELAADQLNRPVGDDLVGVHVRLRA